LLRQISESLMDERMWHGYWDAVKFMRLLSPVQKRGIYALLGGAVQVLGYKPKSRGFESQRSHLFFFNLSNTSSRTTALRLTQPLTEMSVRRFFSV
jgi:hypothetical protein